MSENIQDNQDYNRFVNLNAERGKMSAAAFTASLLIVAALGGLPSDAHAQDDIHKGPVATGQWSQRRS